MAVGRLGRIDRRDDRRDDFATARREAVEAVVSALERTLGMEAAEALALLSLAGDLRIGQAFGGAIPMTLRLEVPAGVAACEPGAARRDGGR